MKIKLALIIIILLISSRVFACECVNGFNISFLGNVKSFDFIVKGNIVKGETDYSTLIIEEVFKGAIKGDTINLIDAFGCDLLLMVDPGDRIIIGLEKFDSSNYSKAYTAPGCITSAFYIKGEKAFAPELQLPMFKKPKIARFRSRMKLHVLERKIRRRVGP